MLDNCRYNKIKLLHSLSCIAWFIDKHALADENGSSHKECKALIQDLKKDLEHYIHDLDEMLCSSK